MQPHAAMPHLFSPLTIGAVTIRNRIMSSGHDTVMARDGLITDQLIAYQEARARGGAGLIVIQVAGVHPTARYTSTELTADTDATIPGYAAIADAFPRPRARRFRPPFPRRAAGPGARDHGHRGRHAGRGPRPLRRAN